MSSWWFYLGIFMGWGVIKWMVANRGMDRGGRDGGGAGSGGHMRFEGGKLRGGQTSLVALTSDREVQT